MNTRRGDTDAENLENIVTVWRQEGLEHDILLKIGYVSTLSRCSVICHKLQLRNHISCILCCVQGMSHTVFVLVLELI